MEESPRVPMEGSSGEPVDLQAFLADTKVEINKRFDEQKRKTRKLIDRIENLQRILEQMEKIAVREKNRQG